MHASQAATGDLKRSSAFALLLPLTKLAEKALKCARRNRVLLDDLEPQDVAIAHVLKHTQPSGRSIAKLDFMSILGRDSLTFGCSRSARFELPKGSGISPRHFRLHLDIDTATLLLTDCSELGTRIIRRAGGPILLLHSDTYRFDDVDDIRIQLGSDPEMEFCIALGNGMRDTFRRRKVFLEHVHSLTKRGSFSMSAQCKKRARLQEDESSSDTSAKRLRRSSGSSGSETLVLPLDAIQCC